MKVLDGSECGGVVPAGLSLVSEFVPHLGDTVKRRSCKLAYSHDTYV